MELWKRNLYVTWFTQIISLAGFGFMHPFLPFYIQEIGITDPDAVRSWVGILTATPSLLLGLTAPMWGYLSDRFGRKLMILRAMAAGAFLLTGMSFTNRIETVMLFRIVQGLFSGTVTASATLVAAGTPTDKLSSSLGFLSSSNFIGFSLGPMLGGLTAEYFGYRVAFRVGGAMLCVAFLLVLFLTREIKEQVPAAAKATDPAGRGTAISIGFVLSLVLLFLVRFSRALPASFIPLHVQEITGTIEGVSATTGVLSAAIGAAAAVSSLTIARLGDRMDKMKLISRLLWMSALCAAPLFFTRYIWDFGLFYLIVAFILGGVEPNLQSFLSEKTDASKRGVVFGAITLVGGVGWSAAPLLGSVVSIGLGIRWLFLFYAAGIGLSYLFLLVSGRAIRYRFRVIGRRS